MHTRVPWNKLNSSQLLFSWTPPNVYLWNNYLSQSQTTWGARAYDIFQDKAFFHFSGLQRKREPQFFREGLTPCRTLKGIIKWAEPCKCGILLVSRILWHERIKPSLKEWRFSYLILTGHFPPKFLLSSLHSAIPVKAAYFHRKKLVT